MECNCNPTRREQKSRLETIRNQFLNKYRSKLKELYQKFDCHPIKSFILPLMQIPLFLSMTWAIRDLAGAKFLWFNPPSTFTPGINTEGLMFIQDLSTFDPTLITPLLVASLHLLNIELGSYLRIQEPTLASRAVLIVFRTLSFGMFWATMHVPAVTCN